MFSKQTKKGFTLLEILMVVGIIAILAGIVIMAINPARQLAIVRNAERSSDLKQLYNALQQYYIDHSGYPDSITSELKEICDTGTASSTEVVSCGNLVNLTALVPDYIIAITRDPQILTGGILNNFLSIAYADNLSGTGYEIMRDSNNKIIIVAPHFELGNLIAIGTTTISIAGCETDFETGFSSGDGSSDDPYQICSWEQLDNVRNDLSANYILTSNLSALDPNYTSFGSQWIPIGDCGTDCEQVGENNPFSGSFDGGNFVISNLITDLPVINGVGLFGYVTGDISNIDLDNININGHSYVGGLVGLQQAGEISSVNISGSVSGYSYVGGIVGYQAGGNIYNSFSSASVSEN